MSGESSPHHQRARERREPECTGERDLLLAPLRLRAKHIERADAFAAAYQRHVHAGMQPEPEYDSVIVVMLADRLVARADEHAALDQHMAAPVALLLHLAAADRIRLLVRRVDALDRRVRLVVAH